MFQYKKLDGDKQAVYRGLHQQLAGLLHDEDDWLANTANTAALLYSQLTEVNWAGFYFLKDNELVLGPFQGLPACVRIPLGKGVCGTAAIERQTYVVADVQAFPGHIACDAASRSEIVIPIMNDGQLIGVLDIDSPIKERFDDVDQLELEKVVTILNRETDWAANLV